MVAVLPWRRSPYKTERCPPTACLPLRQGLRAFDGFTRSAPVWPGNEIANSGVSEPKGPTMIVNENRRPTHRVYAVRKISDGKSHWAEIGAAWANRDGRGFNLKLTLMPVGDLLLVVDERW